LFFYVDHLGYKAFVIIQFFVQHLNIVSVKLMIEFYAMICDNRSLGGVSSDVISMFINSCV